MRLSGSLYWLLFGVKNLHFLLKPLLLMLLSDNMTEYIACLSMLVLMVTGTYNLCIYMTPNKRVRGKILNKAQLLFNTVWKIISHPIQYLAFHSKLKCIAEAMYQFILPFLDLTTAIFIQGSTCISRHYASHRKCKRKRRATYRDLWVLSAMASTTTDAKKLRISPVICQFDTDSFLIGLDSYSSRCVSNKRSHFKDLRPAPSQFGSLRGIGGNTPIQGIGTLNWKVEDDFGATHQLVKPNSLYVPKSPKCLLSPQHLAQVSPRAQLSTTYLEMRHDRGILHWGPGGKYRRTGMINKSSNTPNIFSAPVCNKFHQYSALANMECHMCATELVCYPAHIIPDDDFSVGSEEN